MTAPREFEDRTREPRRVVPALDRFYAQATPFAWPIVRIGVGWLLLVHGYGKLLRGMAGQARLLDQSLPGFAAFNLPLAYVLTFVEGLGGACIILGLFTRFFAAANAIEMGFLTFVLYWGNGFSWLNRGYEFTLLWGAMCLAIALRGGGPYSLDRKLGAEL